MIKAASIFLLLILSVFLPAISLSQNLGIGVANPTLGRLEVVGSVGNNNAIFGGDGAGISLQRNYPAIGYNQYYIGRSYNMVPGTAMVQYLDMPGGSLCFDGFGTATAYDFWNGNGIRRLTMRNNGNVSIAATEANASLFVSGHIQGISTARFRGTTYHSVFADRVTGQSHQHTYINAGKNGGAVIINDQGLGNVIIGGTNTRVGINVADPTAVLDIKQVNARGIVLVSPAYSFNNWAFTVNHEPGEFKSDLWMYYNEGYKGNFFSEDGLYYKASDSRLKTNIKDMFPVLSLVLNIRPVEYEMKYHNPGKIRSIGLIAQEVRSFFPELARVSDNPDNGYEGIKDLHSMDYDALGPIAIKAIQEQQQKIKELKQLNNNLRTRLAAAEKLFSEIKLVSK